MTNATSYRVDTPCGFDIWIIPMDNDTIRWRAFFKNEEVGMDWLSGKLSREGAIMFANKLKEITNN